MQVSIVRPSVTTPAPARPLSDGVSFLPQIDAYITKADKALSAIPGIQENTDTITAWIPYITLGLGGIAAGLILLAVTMNR